MPHRSKTGPITSPNPPNQRVTAHLEARRYVRCNGRVGAAHVGCCTEMCTYTLSMQRTQRDWPRVGGQVAAATRSRRAEAHGEGPGNSEMRDQAGAAFTRVVVSGLNVFMGTICRAHVGKRSRAQVQYSPAHSRKPAAHPSQES